MVSERAQLVGQEVTLPQATLRTETAKSIDSLVIGVRDAPQIKTALAEKFFGPIRADESQFAVSFNIKGCRHGIKSIWTDTVRSISIIIQDGKSIRELRMYIGNSGSENEPISCGITFTEVGENGTINTVTDTIEALVMGNQLAREFVQAANIPYVPHS